MKRWPIWLRLSIALTLPGVVLAGSHPSEATAEVESSRDNPVWLDPDRRAPLNSIYFAFHSTAANRKASCLVWVPPSYRRRPNARFPVIYWLHGANGDQRRCARSFLPNYIEALKERATRPAIVVAVNGIPRSFYGNSVSGRCPVERMIIDDLVPSIDRRFRTKPNPESRCIEGFSMGGFGAARLGFKYPDIFGVIVINASGPAPAGSLKSVPSALRPVFGDRIEELPIKLAEANADTLREGTMIRLACGKADSLLAGNQHLHRALERLGIDHVYFEVSDVGHNPIHFYRKLGVRAFRFHSRAFETSQPPRNATRLP